MKRLSSSLALMLIFVMVLLPLQNLVAAMILEPTSIVASLPSDVQKLTMAEQGDCLNAEKMESCCDQINCTSAQCASCAVMLFLPLVLLQPVIQNTQHYLHDASSITVSSDYLFRPPKI